MTLLMYSVGHLVCKAPVLAKYCYLPPWLSFSRSHFLSLGNAYKCPHGHLLRFRRVCRQIVLYRTSPPPPHSAATVLIILIFHWQFLSPFKRIFSVYSGTNIVWFLSQCQNGITSCNTTMPISYRTTGYFLLSTTIVTIFVLAWHSVVLLTSKFYFSLSIAYLPF